MRKLIAIAIWMLCAAAVVVAYAWAKITPATAQATNSLWATWYVSEGILRLKVEPSQADAFFKKAIALDPTAIRQINGGLGSALVDDGIQLIAIGKAIEAEHKFYLARHLYKVDDSKFSIAKAEAHHAWAWRSFLKKDFGAALLSVNRAIFLQAEESNYLDTRAHINLALEKYEQAFSDFDRAIRAGFESAPTFVGRGQTREMRLEPALAVDDYRTALSMQVAEGDTFALEKLQYARERLQQLQPATAAPNK